MAKYNIEDVKQDEKHVPDLLESIMKAPALVKEELRQFLLNDSIWVQNPKDQGFNFLDSGNPMFSHLRPMPAFSPASSKQ